MIPDAAIERARNASAKKRAPEANPFRSGLAKSPRPDLPKNHREVGGSNRKRHRSTLWPIVVLIHFLSSDGRRLRSEPRTIFFRVSIKPQKKVQSRGCGASPGAACALPHVEFLLIEIERAPRAVALARANARAHSRRCACAGNCDRTSASASISSSATAKPSSSSSEASTRPQGSTINECP